MYKRQDTERAVTKVNAYFGETGQAAEQSANVIKNVYSSGAVSYTHLDVYKRQLHTQPNRKLFDVMLQGSGDARMQPLYFLSTTAGNDTNSICYEMHQKAIDIAEGRKVDPTFY